MLSCHQATRLASESQERTLSFKERMALKIHTMICDGCRNFQNNAINLRKAMQGFANGDYESNDNNNNNDNNDNKR